MFFVWVVRKYLFILDGALLSSLKSQNSQWMYPFNPSQILLINTTILLSSGVTAKEMDYKMIKNIFFKLINGGIYEDMVE